MWLCDHVGCKQKEYVLVLRSIIKGREYTLLFSLLLPAGWNAEVMAGTSAAILDFEVILKMEFQMAEATGKSLVTDTMDLSTN